MLDQQAFMLAANDVFYGSAVIFLFLIPLVWLSHPPRNGGRASADAAAAAH
jgi:DHA2 family multidrug resistance protein